MSGQLAFVFLQQVEVSCQWFFASARFVAHEVAAMPLPPCGKCAPEKASNCILTHQAAFRSDMDKDDILSLDLSALDPSAGAGIDRSHSAPTFLESR